MNDVGAHDHSSLATYAVIFFALLALTLTTVAVSYVDLGPLSTPIALIIAVVKATLILAYFMHLRHQHRLLLGFAIVGITWVLILMSGTFDDYLTR